MLLNVPFTTLRKNKQTLYYKTIKVPTSNVFLLVINNRESIRIVEIDVRSNAKVGNARIFVDFYHEIELVLITRRKYINNI